MFSSHLVIRPAMGNKFIIFPPINIIRIDTKIFVYILSKQTFYTEKNISNW